MKQEGRMDDAARQQARLPRTELARVNRALRMLSDSNRALTRISDETAWLNDICRNAVDSGGYRMAWVGFAEHDESKTVRPVAQAGFEAGYLESARITWGEGPRGRGPAGTAIRAGRPSIIRNIATDESFVPWRDAASARGYQSSIGLPLTSEGRTFGVLCLYAGSVDAFDTEEVDVLTELANDLAFGVGVLRTRADRERVTEALKESERRLEEAQRLEALGRLAGGVAHDFNNLLTSIGGFTNLVLRSLEDERDPRRADLLEVQRAVERAAALTRQLLAFGRRQVLQPKVLDLNSLITGLQPLLRRTIGEHIDLRLSLDPNLDRVSADGGQLEQVLINLAVNARDAMPHGGELRFATDVVLVDEAWQRRHPAMQTPIAPGRYARVTVSDNGEGMSPETQARIFEPFFSTKPAGKGTGLGLATVYGTVSQSGGFIWVHSQINEGSSFQIYLPAVPADAASRNTGSGNAAADRHVEGLALAPSSGGTETILLAEDDGSVRRLAQRTLTEAGYRVIVARDGEEALALARRTSGDIDLLVADIVMPGLTGFALAERLKADRPAMRVIFTTGYAENVTVRADNALGSFIGKPFLPPDLLRCVREKLDTL
jgi:two-component system cell cycle sensor histidine kinase/response regulator CckA